MAKLNLGCGENWKVYYDYDGLDIIDYGQKYVVNILDFFMGGTPKVQFVERFEEVRANHFLEHFNQDDLRLIFSGVHKILKPNGFFRFCVPHMKKDEAWVLSHKTFWNKFTVRWLEREDANLVYGFGKWKIEDIVVNEREDIHASLIKLV